MKIKDLGIKLKTVRDSLGLSQAELAEILEIDQGRLSKIESNSIQLSAKLAYKLGTKLNVNPNYLLSLEPNMYLNKQKVDAFTVNEPLLANYNLNDNGAKYFEKMEENFALRNEIIELKTEILELKTELLNLKR